MRTRPRNRQPISMFESAFNMFAQLGRLDSDRDGVPDHKDCRPFNPFMHTTGYIYDEEGNILEKGDLVKIAKKHFGVTSEPREAGYILPGGEMLDFTGRHEATGYKDRVPTNGDYLKNTRSVDHRVISQVMKLGLGGTESMIQFQSEDGAIRFSKFEDGDIHIDMVKKPTPEQIETIVKAMTSGPIGDYLIIERTNEQGIVVNPVKHRLETNRPHPVLLQKFISRAWEK